MAYEYLAAMNLSDGIREKLRRLGALTGSALLSKLEFAPDQSKAYLGSDEYHLVTAQLRDLDAIEEEETPRDPLPAFQGYQGARLNLTHNLAAGVARRTELPQAITNLRRSGDSSSTTQDKLQILEKELKETFKSTVS